MELAPIAKPDRRGNENGILFLTVYYFLKDILGELTEEDRITYNNIVRALKTYGKNGVRYAGLYDRGAGESKVIPPEQLRTISRDNLLAIAAGSVVLDLPYRHYIYQHGKKYNWRFDNAYPEKPRWSRRMTPFDTAYWVRIGGTRTSRLLVKFQMGLYYLQQLVTCYKKEHVRPSNFQKFRALFTKEQLKSPTRDYATSGKILAFVTLYPLQNESWVARVVWKACKWLVKRHGMGGYLHVINHYYKDENHPIRKDAKKVADLGYFD